MQPIGTEHRTFPKYEIKTMACSSMCLDHLDLADVTDDKHPTTPQTPYQSAFLISADTLVRDDSDHEVIVVNVRGHVHRC